MQSSVFPCIFALSENKIFNRVKVSNNKTNQYDYFLVQLGYLFLYVISEPRSLRH